VSDLLSIARRFLPAGPGEKGEKGEKPPAGALLSPIPPFSHPSAGGEVTPTLAGAEPWDQRTALRLLLDADTLVERLGIDGQLPTIREAAAVVTSALATRDLETVRLAVAEFEAVVRGVAASRRETPAA
jgi:hypothetical protein